MSSAASHISTTTSALSEGLQTIKNNMGTLEMVRSNGGYVSAMNADEVQAQINDLSNALGNIGMALDAAATLLSKLNGGWPMACAAGFASGSSVYPTFTPNAFDPLNDSSQMNIGRGGKGREPGGGEKGERRVRKTLSNSKAPSGLPSLAEIDGQLGQYQDALREARKEFAETHDEGRRQHLQEEIDLYKDHIDQLLEERRWIS